MARKVSGRPMKLSLENCIPNFILNMKYDNVNVLIYDSHDWNSLRSSLCDDTFFIASCIKLTVVLKGR